MRSPLGKLVPVALLILLASPTAWACNGKEILFDEPFSAWDPAWGVENQVDAVKDGKRVVAPEANQAHPSLFQNALFEDMDLCVTIRLVRSPDPSVRGGVLFWATDYSEYYFLSVSAEGSYGVLRLVNGRWLFPVTWRPDAALKKGLGAENELRVVTKGDQATVYLNGKEAVRFRGQPPKGGGFIGIHAQSPTAGRATWEFTDLKVTR
jgi:hypothetical protein